MRHASVTNLLSDNRSVFQDLGERVAAVAAGGRRGHVSFDMGLTDRQAADLRKGDAITKAYATMNRHKMAQRQNPGMAFRNGLRDALPELKRDLIEVYSDLDGAGEPPMRDELRARRPG